MRLDQYLVQKNLASSRTKAQEMIERKEVEVVFNGKPIQVKASLEVTDQMCVTVHSSLEKYVSRAGFKLENALDKTGLDVKGLTVLDIGLSTGGFTGCLLHNGAAHIVGVDVGSDQLHPSLKGNPKLTVLEKTDARELAANSEILCMGGKDIFDLLVMDVSFISVTKIILHLIPLLKSQAKALILFKPQFEVGPSFIGKNGIVDDQSAVENSLREFSEFCLTNNLKNYFLFRIWISRS